MTEKLSRICRSPSGIDRPHWSRCASRPNAALARRRLAAGLAIAMACDIRIAAQSAFVSTGYLAGRAEAATTALRWLLTRFGRTSRGARN